MIPLGRPTRPRRLRFLHLLLAILPLLAVLGDTPTARGGGPEESSITVPERVVIPVGGTTDFTVEVDREKLEGKATVEVTGLPEGVTVEKQTATLGSKEDSLSVALRASGDIKADQDHKLTVVVATAEGRQWATFTLHTEHYTLDAVSWVIMLVSVLTVLLLVSFCLIRVLTLPPTEEESIKGPLEIDTGDTQNAD
jgi:hypothetical protein